MHKQIGVVLKQCEELEALGFTQEAEAIRQTAQRVEGDELNRRIEAFNSGKTLIIKNCLQREEVSI